MNDVISMRDFTKEEILAILDLAADIKRARHQPSFQPRFKKKYGYPLSKLLEGVMVGTLFLENSTRTNYSFRAAVGTAKGFVDGFPSEDNTSLKKGETWAQTAAMFANLGYQVLIMRSTAEGLPRWTKEFLERNHQLLVQQHRQFKKPFSYQVPAVINGGDGKNQHPTQCLLDLFTLREVAHSLGKDLEGLSLALTNDLAHGRTNASLISVAHLFNFELHFAYPKRFGPPKHRLEDLALHNVRFYDHKDNLMEALASALFDYHSRPQKERVGKGEDLISIKEWGSLTQERYKELGNQAPYLLHPLPVDAETFEEIYYDMAFHPKNLVNYQASNGLYLRIANLALGSGRIDLGFLNRSNKLQEMTLKNLPLSTKIKKIKKPRSGYIKGEGVVLDHIPLGMAERLSGVLGLRKEGLPKVIADYLPLRDGGEPVKDMIKIHCPYQFSKEQYEAIALIAPDITINFIQNSQVIRKVRPRLGNCLENRIKCHNKDCATNIKKEHILPKHHLEEISGERILRCNYCEVTDDILHIHQGNRFIYIGEEETKKY